MMGKEIIKIEKYECDFCGEQIGGKPEAFASTLREFYICDDCKDKLKKFLKEHP